MNSQKIQKQHRIQEDRQWDMVKKNNGYKYNEKRYYRI